MTDVNRCVISPAAAGDDEFPSRQAAKAIRVLAAMRVFSASADQVHQARRFTADLLKGWPVADDTVLCVSELATNALLHSASREEGGTFAVHLEAFPGEYIQVAVHDEGGPWIRQEHEHGDGRAHGLDIVRQLASQFGVHGDASRGWTVWARLEVAEHLSGSSRLRQERPCWARTR